MFRLCEYVTLSLFLLEVFSFFLFHEVYVTYYFLISCLLEPLRCCPPVVLSTVMLSYSLKVWCMAMGMDRMVVWPNGEKKNLNVPMTWALIVALTSKTHLAS
jgi:hypothetical protein